jgi:hypothetical protein
MANQKENFLANMRKATGPNNPPGGSKLVRGREPIVIEQANMISSFVDEDGDGAVPSSDPALALAASSRIVPALPSSTGLFDEEYEHGKRVMSPPIPISAPTSEPITGKRTNQEAPLPSPENAHLPKRANQEVPLAPPGELPLAERPGQFPASAPHVEGPTLCVGFAIREGSVIATIDCDLESPEVLRSSTWITRGPCRKPVLLERAISKLAAMGGTLTYTP